MVLAPEFLVIGHVTRDVLPDGAFSLGGTVTFAALTAHHLGMNAGIVTCADPLLSSELPALLSGVALHICPSTATTTFANSYTNGFRIQYLHHRAAAIQPEDVPMLWRDAPIVLLGPLAQEFSAEVVALFPRRPGAIIAATPQGWLRRWDADGRVWSISWDSAAQILPLLDALILSYDDLLPFASGSRDKIETILAQWSSLVPLLVATDGRHGATLFQGGSSRHFAAFSAHEVDPTGAGDVFAAAFLTHLYRYGDPALAVEFANCTASFAIEKAGIQGIPTLEMVTERLATRT